MGPPRGDLLCLLGTPGLQVCVRPNLWLQLPLKPGECCQPTGMLSAGRGCPDTQQQGSPRRSRFQSQQAPEGLALEKDTLLQTASQRYTLPPHSRCTGTLTWSEMCQVHSPLLASSPAGPPHRPGLPAKASLSLPAAARRRAMGPSLLCLLTPPGHRRGYMHVTSSFLSP